MTRPLHVTDPKPSDRDFPRCSTCHVEHWPSAPCEPEPRRRRG